MYEAGRTGKEVDGKSNTGGDLCHVDSSNLQVTAKKEKEENSYKGEIERHPLP